MLIVELLDYIEGSFAQRLAYWVEKHKNQIRNVAEPKYCFVHVEWIFHVTVDKTRRVDESNQAELFLFACSYLGAYVLETVLNINETFQLRVEMESGVTQKGFAFFPTRDQCETLSLNCNPGFLDRLFDIPLKRDG